MPTPKRARDIGRKYPSGNLKRTLNKLKQAAKAKQHGALDNHFNFIKTNPKASEEAGPSSAEFMELEESNKTTQESVVNMEISQSEATTSQSEESISNRKDQEDDDAITGQSEEISNRGAEEIDVDLEILQADDTTNQSKESIKNQEKEDQNSSSLEDQLNITDDPITWPKRIDQRVRDYLVKKGPPKIRLEDFPRNEKGKHFSKIHCQRKLSNGEIIHRPWIIYSESADRVFCFFCRLFGNDVKSALANNGFDDWPNIHTRLSAHEKSKGHLGAMVNCCELQRRLSAEETVDKIEQKQIDQEKRRWRQVFERLVAVVQFLSERNLAFRGSVEQLGNSHNGNFLGIIELLGKFDPIIQEHLRGVSNKDIQDHYLGKRIQNELLGIMGDAVQNNIVSRIKAAKYFAVILDCTADIRHQEQMSLTVRYVYDGTLPNTPVGVYEQFIKFINVKSSTGENLYNVLKQELEILGLDITNIRGQGYDNGANMRGNVSGVQARLLQENSRAFFTPCACHNYNLILGDMAKTCPDEMTFFGTLQRLYVFFSASTKRWLVFKKYVKGLSAKPLCETRWECRMQSVKSLRYQVGEFYDALLEIAETSEDAQARSEAESLGNQIKEYKFLVSLVFWHDLLFQVNFVSKELQSDSTDLATALSSFEKLLHWMSKYRETGFEQVLVGATELATELEISPEFRTKRLQKRKRHFNYESDDEPITNPKEAYEVNCFNQVVDKALQSLEPRFEQLVKHNDLFGFLGKFLRIPKDELRIHAADLEIALSDAKITEDNELIQCVKVADIDGHMLLEEMEALKPILPESCFENPLNILKFLATNERATGFPNLFISLRIFLTIPVTVASGERSFSRLKLIKTYLRSTTLQERLNSFAILSIESEEARNLNFEKILEDFAEKKARKISF